MTESATHEMIIDRLHTELIQVRAQRDHYKERARLAEVHLRLRTAALIRLIERESKIS